MMEAPRDLRAGRLLPIDEYEKVLAEAADRFPRRGFRPRMTPIIGHFGEESVLHLQKTT